MTAKRNVVIQSIVATGDFSFPAADCIVPIAAKSTCSTTMQFKPSAVGLRTGVLTVTAIDQEDGEQFLVTAPLAGTGLPVQLTSISISPAAANIALGRTQQFQALGNYNDGSTQDLSASATWTSSNPTVATVTGGLAASVAQGSANISAASGSITGLATLTVTAPVLTRLRTLPDSATIKPGATLQLQAVGTYSDSTTRDLTLLASWSSTNSAVATVTPTGLVTGVTDGVTGIQANIGLIWQSVITVKTPRPTSITLSPTGYFTGYFVSKQFSATANFDDGSTRDATSIVTWSSTSPGVASVTSAGLATCLSVGSSLIKASASIFTGTARFDCPFFETYGQMSLGRTHHTATTLKNGDVLIAGGQTTNSLKTTSVEIYSPAARKFTSATPMNTARSGHTATLLPDGRALIAGGADDNSAEIYDPASGGFTPAGALNFPHSNHTATLLNNGKVLIAGGSPEVFDPATNAFTPLPAMTALRLYHTATLLSDGRVFLAGGSGLSSTEFFDPASGLFSSGPNLSTVRDGHAAAATPDGKVLLTGGSSGVAMLNSVDVFDPAANTVVAGPSMIVPHVNHTATLLSNGKILIAGSVAAVTAELYDPISQVYIPGDMISGHVTSARLGHTATTLQDGQVLIVGGIAAFGSFATTGLTFTPQ